MPPGIDNDINIERVLAVFVSFCFDLETEYELTVQNKFRRFELPGSVVRSSEEVERFVRFQLGVQPLREEDSIVQSVIVQTLPNRSLETGRVI